MACCSVSRPHSLRCIHWVACSHTHGPAQQVETHTACRMCTAQAVQRQAVAGINSLHEPLGLLPAL